MKPALKRILLIMLLCSPFVALAQEPSGEAQGAESQSGEQATEGQVPEEQAPEAAPAETEDANRADHGAADEPEPIVDEAADTVDETLPPDPPEEGAAAEEEFEPGEEISEDYPVPLPSDI